MSEIYSFRPVLAAWGGLGESGRWSVLARPGVAEEVTFVRREPAHTVHELAGLRGVAPGRVIVLWREVTAEGHERGGCLALSFDGAAWTRHDDLSFGQRGRGRADEARQNAMREWVKLPLVRWGFKEPPERIERAIARLTAALNGEAPGWLPQLLAGQIGTLAELRRLTGAHWSTPDTEIQAAAAAVQSLLSKQGWITR